MRDLLLLACTSEDDDMNWIFLTNHDFKPSFESNRELNNLRSGFSNETDIEAAFVAGK